MSARNKRVNEMITKDMEKIVISETVELEETIEEIDEEIDEDGVADMENEVIDMTLDFIESVFEKYYALDMDEYFYDEDINVNNWVDHWSADMIFGHEGFIELVAGEMMDIVVKSRNNSGRTSFFIHKSTKPGEPDEMEVYFEGKDLADRKNVMFRFVRRDKKHDAREDMAHLLLYIGMNCAGGRLGMEEVENASKWYQKAADYGCEEAAVKLQHANIEGRISLANHYLKGDCGEQDITKGLKILEELISEGSSEALVTLGIIYFKGQYGVVKDVPRAVEYLEKAVEMDNVDALTFLGYVYMNGVEVEKNVKKGFSYINRAAEKGNTKAIMLCGMAYIEGTDVEQNIEKGLNYITMAAGVGDNMAMRLLADMANIGDK